MGKTTCYTTVLGLTLRELREQQGLTQAKMAEYVGMTSVGWGKLEKGLSALSVENLALATKHLKTRPSTLLALVEERIGLLENQGWTVKEKRVGDEDGLMSGWDMSRVVGMAGVSVGLPTALLPGSAASVAGSVAGILISVMIDKAIHGYEAIKKLKHDFDQK